MKIFKKISILLFLIFIYIAISACSYTNLVYSNLSDNIFRLHIIANSDSKEDQNLKYIVRDNIIKYMNSICSKATSKEECMEMVSNNLSNFNLIANQTISSYGFNYTASSEIGNFKFPQKQYASITLPYGNYDALEIKLGDASGKNWWCVLYPSLCFIDTDTAILSDDSNTLLEENLDDETYNLIQSDQKKSLRIKFKLIEFFNNLKIYN